MANRAHIVRTIEEVLTSFADRIRKLELRQNKIGNWTLVQDRTTGDLQAVYSNGSGTTPTVVTIATAP